MLTIQKIIKINCFLAIVVTTNQELLAQTPPQNINIPNNTPDIIKQTAPKPLPQNLPSHPSEQKTQPNFQITPSQTPVENSSYQFPIKNIKTVEIWDSTVLQTEIIKLIKDCENSKKEKIFTDITQEIDQKENRPKLIAKVNPNIEITFEDLNQLNSAISQKYLDNGYITSGSFIFQNNEAFKQGIIEIYVVEGEIENIKISGLNHLDKSYIEARLKLATQTPLNQRKIQDVLQLLEDNPLIDSLQADLIAGTRSGSNILIVKVKENPTFHTGIYTANNQSPSIGSVKTSVFVINDNLLGFGDSFSANYGLTKGLDSYDLNYTIPINAYDGTIGFSYSNSNSKIIEYDFRDLGIKSKSQTFSVHIDQPISRTFTRKIDQFTKKQDQSVSGYNEFKLGLGLDLRQSQSFLLNNIPFSFSIGPENGESKVTVLRFSQQWLNRDQNRILVARSQFNFGLDVLGATVNNTGTDGRFFSWVGQLQWVQQLSPSVVLLTRVDTQLTPDSLLSLEQFSVGGVETVRGYRQNQLVADNGIMGSMETRINLTSDNKLQLAPFFEIGTAWNNHNPNSNPNTIASLGLGLRYRIFNNFNVRLDYGVPLISVKNQSNSLQEDGFSFYFGYQPW